MLDHSNGLHAAASAAAGAASPRPDARGVAPGVSDFKPRGVLVAHLAEHQHAVNSLAVSASRSSWLASASADGTVRLWGAARDGVQLDKVCTANNLLGTMLALLWRVSSANDGLKSCKYALPQAQHQCCFGALILCPFQHVESCSWRSSHLTVSCSAQIGCFSSLLTYCGHSRRVVDAHFVTPDTSDHLSIASADAAGHIHIWDVEAQRRRDKHQRPTLAFAANSEQGAPVATQLDSGTVTRLMPHGPLLLAATELAGVRAFDARAGARPVWAMEVPSNHGAVTCMAAVRVVPSFCACLRMAQVAFRCCIGMGMYMMLSKMPDSCCNVTAALRDGKSMSLALVSVVL